VNILFFSHYFPPESNVPATRTYEYCRRWVRRGHKVTVVTCVPNVPDGIVYKGYKNKLRQSEVMDGIEVVRVWTYVAANRGRIRRTLNYISYMFSAVLFSLFVRKPDVILATSPQFFCGWAGAIAGRLRRIPFILEIRDIWPDSIAAVGALRNKGILRVLESLELRMYAAARHIVTVGKSYKEVLVKKGIPAQKISVIATGFDCEIFYPRESDEKTRQEHNLNGEFVCSYVGTIGMACGLEVVLHTAKLLKNRQRNDIKFLLVGAGAVKEKLRRQAVEEKLDNVVFVERQDRNAVPEILSVADVCLVHLRKSDHFKTVLPYKMLEATAMAKPTILGVEGYAAQFLREADAGICIEPENAEQLAEAVESLADDPQLCRSLGRAGYEYGRKHHNFDALADDYLDRIGKSIP
jgi:glycosyltransferase involved in cell wall biosynthesis